MKGHARRFFLLFGLLLVLLGSTVTTGYAQPQTQQKISAPGQYSGYTSPEYKSFAVTSQYVTMRDGVRIAVDIYMPTEGPARDKFPTVLVMLPYHRASVTDKGVSQPYASDPTSEFRVVISYGYAFVVADVRGTGASFGSRSTVFAPAEQEDANDLINWIVAQPWSDGNVGMMGQSYLATIQLLAAAQENPHLKCIAPRYSLFDLYDVVYPGGLLDNAFISAYKLSVTYLDGNKTVPELGIWPSKPVDADTDGSLLAQATKEHEKNFDMTEAAKQVPFRDSTSTAGDGSVFAYRDQRRRRPHPADRGLRCGHLQHGRLVRRLHPRHPHHHGYLDEPQQAAHRPLLPLAALRELGHRARPLVRLVPEGRAERHRQGAALLHLHHGQRTSGAPPTSGPCPSSSSPPTTSARATSITTTKPTESGTYDEYLTDYTSTSDTAGRWACLAGVNCRYGDRAELDKKNLTYTTPPLQQDLEVTGDPIVHLFVSSTATDGAFFVYLEDIDENGVVNYITEGELKASLRKLDPRPWKPDLPWHRSYAEDATPLDPRPGGGDTHRPGADLQRVPEGAQPPRLHRRLGQQQLRGAAVRPTADPADVQGQRTRLLHRAAGHRAGGAATATAVSGAGCCCAAEHGQWAGGRWFPVDAGGLAAGRQRRGSGGGWRALHPVRQGLAAQLRRRRPYADPPRKGRIP